MMNLDYEAGFSFYQDDTHMNSTRHQGRADWDQRRVHRGALEGGYFLKDFINGDDNTNGRRSEGASSSSGSLGTPIHRASLRLATSGGYFVEFKDNRVMLRVTGAYPFRL